MLTSDPRFEPPFCPRPSCPHHRDPTGWKPQSAGTFTRKAHPQVIRRFRCPRCKRWFSTQTFDTTYWLKRPDIQKPIWHGLVACSGFRQIGRSLGVTGTTVQRQASRLGRHALLHHERSRPKGPVTEPTAIDGLLGFEFSQYWPFELNIAVGAVSGFTYSFTESELRRSGRMTARQKVRRQRLEEKLGKPDPKATEKAIESLLNLTARAPQKLTVLSDKHQAYPRAIRRLPHEVEHLTFSSRRGRGAGNPLHSVDHLDRMTRHSGANHKRETIAFSKRRQGAMERAAAFVVWMNFMKRSSEKNLRSPTPAQKLGLMSGVLTVDELLYRRLFPWLIPLPPPMDDIYWRRIPTRQIPNGTRHTLSLAA